MHYTLAVIHSSNKNPDSMIGKYSLYNESAQKHRRIFISKDRSLRKAYDNKSTRVPCYPVDGKYYLPGSEGLYREINYDTYKKLDGQNRKTKVIDHKRHYYGYVPKLDSLKMVSVAPSDAFDFDEWVASMGYAKEYGVYGEWELPYTGFDYCEKYKRFTDLSLDRFVETETFFSESSYQKALRWWQVVIDGDAVRPEENPDDFRNDGLNTEFLREEHGCAENFAYLQSRISLYAVVTPDGEWHEYEHGDTFEDYLDAQRTYSLECHKKYVLPYVGKGYRITLFDCHF